MASNSYENRTKARSDSSAPLIFTFHGTGGDEHQFFGLIEQLVPQAGIVSPRGDVSEHGASRFFRRTGEGVYDMDDLAKRTAKMKEFISAHKAKNPQAPTYGLGYSNGANILASVIFDTPELFERVVLMHPLIPWSPGPNPALKGLKALVTGGRIDPICPLSMTQSLVSYLESQGASVELVLHPGGHEVRQEEVAAIGSFFQAVS